MAKKKNKKLSQGFTLFLIAVLVVAILLGFFLWKSGAFDDFLSPRDSAENSSLNSSSNSTSASSSASSENSSSSSALPVIQTEELSIHFPELGNRNTGDCTLIKAGDIEILIDAGSKKNSAAVLVPYIQQYCTDGILEYVIATHAHEDHISAFIGKKDAPGIFESFECKTIIDFALTNNAGKALYNEYVEKRTAEVKAGAVHYTALQCWNETDGAKRQYEIAEGITMNILYNPFYETKTSNENDYSVCMLLSQGENHYLFTGDLEEDGEAGLVEHNDLPHCKLFKAGHHGSYTANSDALLSVIRPEIVCVCCCCGSMERKTALENLFPSQAFVNRISKYTDRIYVPTVAVTPEEGFVSMNGNIVVSSSGGEVKVTCSNNDIIFKDTEWFKKNRDWPE